MATKQLGTQGFTFRISLPVGQSQQVMNAESIAHEIQVKTAKHIVQKHVF